MGNTEESSGIWHRDSRDREEGGCSDLVGVLDTNYPWQARELEEMEREVRDDASSMYVYSSIECVLAGGKDEAGVFISAGLLCSVCVSLLYLWISAVPARAP